MKIWGLAATLGFAVLAFGLGQAVGIGALTAAGFDPLRVGYDGTAVAISLLVANPVQVVTLVLAARLIGEDTFAYFGLDVPRWRDVTIAVAGFAVVIVLADVLTVAFGRDLVPPFQLEVHRSAQASGTLSWLWFAVVVVAPVGEELLFRGFLFRGFVREPRDVLPGILVIALIWSLLHIEYDWFGIGVVFVVGVLFGYVRHYSGSTTLVILLHMLLNLESMLETVVALGRG
jgi:membrane protease YdiL (CAAX protease family)